MKGKINIELNSRIPIYKQIVKTFQDLIKSGDYRKGDFIPSLNELAEELGISKETAKKAYSVLRQMAIIESSQGKGYFISSKKGDKIKILLLFDKISTYKQDLFNSFAETIGDRAEITIHLHNQDIQLLEYFLKENLDNFDYYIITPHFPLAPDIQKRVIKTLKKIPNRKLILLDRYIEELPGNFGSVYQDFEKDIIVGLSQAKNLLKKYKRLNVLSMPGSLYAPLIEKGIKQFSKENKININIIKQIDICKIRKKDSFLILNGQLDIELIRLIKTAQNEGFKIGEDIGIISYNESAINEIILTGLTVLSTDFMQMGELTAKMILEKSLKKIRCNFSLIKRNTF